MSYKTIFITQEETGRKWMQIEHEGFVEVQELPFEFEKWADKNQQDWIKVHVLQMIDKLHAMRRQKLKLVAKKADA